MKRADLEQFFTPEWAALELVRHYYGDLTLCDRVLDPSCGDGVFLRAVPDHVPMIGVEIDPGLIDTARSSSGRPVILGDFTRDAIPFEPTLILGNPPFRQTHAFLERAYELLPNDGEVGFILPAFIFQTASTVDRLAERWHLRQDMIPRNVFPRMQAPLCFARLTKGRRGMIGFALYHETHTVNRLQARYRALLAQGERSVWKAVTLAALEACGGRADLPTLYREIGGARPTSNRFWQEKVRQQLQAIAVRVGPGEWALPVQVAA